MRKTQPRDPLPLPWVNPDQRVHPCAVALLKFQDSDETVFRCTACGELLHEERPERHATMEAEQTASGGQGLIQSCLDDETSEMYDEWKSASGELERKKLSQKWRLAARPRNYSADPG